MTLPLGQKLKIRAMIYVAAEPISFFWPMRAFIYRNPLYGFERMPFPEAVEKGARLFHGRGFLRRVDYQRYLRQGKIDQAALAARVEDFTAEREPVPGIDLARWLMVLLTETQTTPFIGPDIMAEAADVWAVLHDQAPSSPLPNEQTVADRLRRELLGPVPVYEAVDLLHGTEVGSELDELVTKSCLDFFDEGQSVWGMPGRSQGFFAAWRDLARRNGRLYLRGLHINRVLGNGDSPEDVIANVMQTLGVAEEYWMGYFTRELVRLYGWAGFIRWRSSAKHYYWNERYPADLVDLMAVRLTLALALLNERGRSAVTTVGGVMQAIEQSTRETYLRYELHSGAVLPALAARVEQTLAVGRREKIESFFLEYAQRKRAHEAGRLALNLRDLAKKAGDLKALSELADDRLHSLLAALRRFERQEGIVWLDAMEAHAISRLLEGISLTPPLPQDKRPFAQAVFCIDTRSERLRRHLESVGDYQTFSIAGFFGVPISFIELGKGSEAHLCPVLVTPRGLALEMAVSGPREDTATVTTLDKVLHELKESVLSPFVTVEAIGLLFGFDMMGKTLVPRQYNRWRRHLHEQKPRTHLLLDKLSHEQADSIVRAVQRAVIRKALKQEFGLEMERINDSMVRELREVAMGNQQRAPESAKLLKLDDAAEEAFIVRLREVYRINPTIAQLQMERLARLGFSLDEQVGFVGQALRSIGLAKNFSRFILLVGHGSTSENNPYESALDCGACGGNHGLVNARVLAQMANKPEVRRKLRSQGVEIADDAWFVPALHDTTTDKLQLFDLNRLPSSHVVYVDRLRSSLAAASRLCTGERVPTLLEKPVQMEPAEASKYAQRNAMDWSQVRPEWGLAGNAYFVIGRRALTESSSFEGRAFLHSYDYRLDPKRRLLANILGGPLIVGQWISMEYYFSTVDNERFGSGSKVYHNIAGRFGVMTGNLSDLRTGLPAQSVLQHGLPYHEPLRLITVIEAPFEHARRAVEEVTSVKYLVRNSWIRLLIITPEQGTVYVYADGQWEIQRAAFAPEQPLIEESTVT